jgi:hypothetical protein
MFLSHCLVAAQRAQRGETFSARWMLLHATRFLVQLLGGGPDSLDPLRRFHHDALDRAMRLEPLEAVHAMLSICENECGIDARAVDAVRYGIEN